MNSATVAILDHMAALADPIRVRMLLALERHELTVTELCTILQLPQSTVSRHLKTLADDGWVVSRRDGTSRFYGMANDGLDTGARQL
jgi:ArsR family transcriptional regulator